LLLVIFFDESFGFGSGGKILTVLKRKILTVLKWKILTVWKGKFWQFEKENFDSLKRKILTVFKAKNIPSYLIHKLSLQHTLMPPKKRTKKLRL
jgi:hypothetical protein